MSTTEKKINLVINSLSQTKYNELKNNHQLCAEQLYLVNDPNLDAGSKSITNVGDPVNQTDAATKNYVDAMHIPDSNTRYLLLTHIPVLSSIEIEGETLTAYTCQLSDFSVNTIQISSNSNPYYLYMPAKMTSKARDFMVRVEVLSDFSEMPTLGFIGSNNESVDFESEDDSWTDLEVGVNLFNFTETKQESN